MRPYNNRAERTVGIKERRFFCVLNEYDGFRVRYSSGHSVTFDHTSTCGHVGRITSSAIVCSKPFRMVLTELPWQPKKRMFTKNYCLISAEPNLFRIVLFMRTVIIYDPQTATRIPLHTRAGKSAGSTGYQVLVFCICYLGYNISKFVTTSHAWSTAQRGGLVMMRWEG